MQTIGAPPNAPQGAGVVYTKRLRAALQVRVFLQFLLIFLYGYSTLHPWVVATAKEISSSFMVQVALCWVPLGIICVVCALPYSWYGFHLDRKFGLSRSGFRARAFEAIKANAVAFVFTGAIVACAFAPHRFSAPLGWLWSATLCSLLYVALGRSLPWLFSLFYPVATLGDPALHERLNRLANKAGIRLANMLEWHISGRTRQANALVSGIGPARRILLTDTLIKELSADEVEAIVAHELGHLALHHLWKRTLLQWASFCAILGAINFCVLQGLVWLGNQDLGWSDLKLVPGIFLYWQIGHIYGNLLLAALARRQEKEADLYSWKLVGSTKPFVTAMRKLAELNLIVFDRSEQWKYSHPPTPDRIAAAEKYEMAHSVNSFAQVAGD